MSKQLSLYCIQFPFCTRSKEHLDTMKKNGGNSFNVQTAEDVDSTSHICVELPSTELPWKTPCVAPFRLL